MKNLQDRIKDNAQYFNGIEVSEGYYIVKVTYPSKWGIYNSTDGLVQCVKSNKADNLYLYYGSMTETSLDTIFDVIEETIKTNIEAALKVELMMKKIEELKELFSTETLERLNTLIFTFAEKAQPKSDEATAFIEAEIKKKSSRKEKKTEVVSENNKEEQTEETENA